MFQFFLTATLALSLSNSESQQTVDRLVAALDDKDPDVRLSAVEALGKLGPDATSAAPALINILNDKHVEVNARAIWALGQFGVDALPTLLEASRSRDLIVRVGVAQALDEIGFEGLPMLLDSLSDPRRVIRRAAADALLSLGPVAQDLAKDALTAALDHKNLAIRIDSALVLARITPPSQKPNVPSPLNKPVVSVLTEGLADPDDSVRTEVVKTLSQHEANAASVVASLFFSKNRVSRRLALSTLTRFKGRALNHLVAELVRQATQPEVVVRDYVWIALDRAEAKLDPEMVPKLTPELFNENPDVAVAAARLLKRIGPAGDPANLGRWAPFDFPPEGP